LTQRQNVLQSPYDRDIDDTVAGGAGAGVESEGEIGQNEPDGGVAADGGGVREAGRGRAGRDAGARSKVRRDLGRLLFGRGIIAEDAAVILVDTSVIVPWLDRSHPAHAVCTAAMSEWLAREALAVSAVTFAELAAGARTREHVEEALSVFARLEVDCDAAWRAGQAFRQYRRKDNDDPVLPDFFIRAQAATRRLPHLTNDRRRTRCFPDVDFEFVG
jgi:predicted nucleic acid-binding protein